MYRYMCIICIHIILASKHLENNNGYNENYVDDDNDYGSRNLIMMTMMLY